MTEIKTELASDLIEYLQEQNDNQARQLAAELRQQVSSNLLDCPECGWPGTYLEGLDLVCSKCGHRMTDEKAVRGRHE